MTPDQPSAAFVPLPDPWPDAPVCILGMIGPCDDCCTAVTGGDLCRACDKEYERIAEFLRPYIRATEVDAYRRAARAVCWMCDNGLSVHRGDRHLVDYTASDGEVTIQEQMCIAAPIHALIPPAGSEKE